MVRAGKYVPERGNIVWLEFSPQAGPEQAGVRHALVLSPGAYNSKTNLCLACPITSKRKGYPFEVALPDGLKVAGVALADQLKSLDWKARNARFVCEAPIDALEETIAKATTLLEDV